MEASDVLASGENTAIVLQAEIQEIQNAVDHLVRSNQELEDFLKEIPGGDPDFELAIKENIITIDSKRKDLDSRKKLLGMLLAGSLVLDDDGAVVPATAGASLTSILGGADTGVLKEDVSSAATSAPNAGAAATSESQLHRTADCAGCSRAVPRDGYSSKQWKRTAKKGGEGKGWCRECTESNNTAGTGMSHNGSKATKETKASPSPSLAAAAAAAAAAEKSVQFDEGGGRSSTAASSKRRGFGRSARDKARFAGRTAQGQVTLHKQAWVAEAAEPALASQPPPAPGACRAGCMVELWRGDIIALEGVDAIVNAANIKMLGGGGVDGAIHKAAGPELKRLCEQVPEVSPGVRCPTGEARITRSGKLEHGKTGYKPKSAKGSTGTNKSSAGHSSAGGSGGGGGGGSDSSGGTGPTHVVHTVGPIHPCSPRFHQKKKDKWKVDYAADEVEGLLEQTYSNSLKVAREAGLSSIAFPAISCGVFGYPYNEGADVALRVCAAEGTGSIRRVCFILYEQQAWDAFENAFTARVAGGQLVEVPLEPEHAAAAVTDASSGVGTSGALDTDSVKCSIAAAAAAVAAAAAADPKELPEVAVEGIAGAGAGDAKDIKPAPPGWL